MPISVRTMIQLAIAVIVAMHFAAPAQWTAPVVDLRPESAVRSTLSGCASPNGSERNDTSRVLIDVHCEENVSTIAQRSIVDPTYETSKPDFAQQTPMYEFTPDRFDRPPKREEQN